MVDEREDRPPTASDAHAARIERLAQRRSGAPPSPSADPPVNRRARRHPAARARAAAIGLSFVSTAGLTALFTVTPGTDGTQVAAASIVTAATSSVPPTTSPTGAPAATATTARATAVVDGGVFHNRWGDVQVEATFGPDGALASVDAIRTPNDRDKSIRINDAAVPRLNDEAITAQSAAVDTVSGATYTSNDYRRSLQSAIDAAHAASLTQLV